MHTPLNTAVFVGNVTRITCDNGGLKEKLLTPDAVAHYLGIPRTTLHYWRRTGKGPEAVLVGRLLRYDPAAVRQWKRSVTRPGHRRMTPHDTAGELVVTTSGPGSADQPVRQDAIESGLRSEVVKARGGCAPRLGRLESRLRATCQQVGVKYGRRLCHGVW
jgi:predicted DNA-binding transcriptional regulator AlpA